MITVITQLSCTFYIISSAFYGPINLNFQFFMAINTSFERIFYSDYFIIFLEHKNTLESLNILAFFR